MKAIRNKKAILIMPALACMLLFTGAGKKNVRLLKHGLIDLDKAIELARWGGEENGSSDSVSENEESDSDYSSQGQGGSSSSAKGRALIKIVINVKQIELDGRECDIDDLEEKLEELCSRDSNVLLTDDYAEAHVYRRVNDIITGLRDRIGFAYATK